MNEYRTLEQVARILDPGRAFYTVGDVVNAVVDLGNTDKVYTYHDEHLGLKENLSPEFLKTPLEELVEENHREDIQEVLGQASIIIPLSERDLSEEDEEEIIEDKKYRGEDTDD